MSDDVRTEPPEEKEPPSLRGGEWRGWYRGVKVGVADMRAVAEDRLRRKRERDLGVREATRLYNDARDKLARLFAYAEDAGRGDGDGSGGSPAD
jgi:hypothetical protein